MTFLVLFFFLASVDNFDTCWFVKLTNSDYGISVHQKLATNGLVPQLYSFKHLKGAPVMEYLPPPSPQKAQTGGWVTLYKFARNLRVPLVQRVRDADPTMCCSKSDENGNCDFSASARDVRIVDFWLGSWQSSDQLPAAPWRVHLSKSAWWAWNTDCCGHDRTVVNIW